LLIVVHFSIQMGRQLYFYVQFRAPFMININDTIGAVSTSAIPVGSAGRTIIRLSGPGAFSTVQDLLTEPLGLAGSRVVDCKLCVSKGLAVNGRLYSFIAPASYTGQDLCEIHIEAGAAIVKALLNRIYKQVRPAGPGEFTQRAYLNGKLDLTQAEAVAQIVSGANAAQLQAAQVLLQGRFTETIHHVREGLLDLLGRLEAGLDFSEEAIEFVTRQDAGAIVKALRQRLSDLLASSVECERMIDLDAVGLAGLPNAGKSSLLNALLGRVRSIVSQTEATTRDVLTGVLALESTDCVVFDCAGLLNEARQQTLVDRMAHQASVEALRQAALVVFCVDSTKTDTAEDAEMLRRIGAESVIHVATKADRVSAAESAATLARLNDTFAAQFLAVSAQSGQGLETLKKTIQLRLLTLRAGDAEHQDRLTINERHRLRLQEAVDTLAECAAEIDAESTEIAAMLLRQAVETLGGLERENIDETILDRIFSRFCIGK
jgi:tRNA modification GTPase